MANVLAASEMIEPCAHAAIAPHEVRFVALLDMADESDAVARKLRLQDLADAPDEADRS